MKTTTIANNIATFNRNEDLNIIKFIVGSFRKVEDRQEMLRFLGYEVDSLPMGSGGVMQKKVMSDNSLRVQIGYGVTKWNYAQTVTLR